MHFLGPRGPPPGTPARAGCHQQLQSHLGLQPFLRWAELPSLPPRAVGQAAQVRALLQTWFELSGEASSSLLRKRVGVGAVAATRPCREGPHGVGDAPVQGQHGPGSGVQSGSLRVGKAGKRVNFALRIYLGVGMIT